MQACKIAYTLLIFIIWKFLRSLLIGEASVKEEGSVVKNPCVFLEEI